MKKLAFLALIPSLVQAGPFWHPEAKSITAAGPDYITVCQWWPSPSSFQNAVWECEDLWSFGARRSVKLELFGLGPVKVFARWAYAVDAQDNLVPMQEGVMD
jgi:hypothetical protein